jgi:hypothetical protein
MSTNKLIVLIFCAIVAITLSKTVYAKNIYPAEIVGRDLDYPGLGWAGHVGIATTTMSSAKGMSQNADQVIEILNEPMVGQINSIANFKSRSKYWGSKYGIADRGERGYRVLVEANHQRWWCPEYTSDTDYKIGEGNPHTGARIRCGRWRCDTFIWWAFLSQGWDTMPGRVWMPKTLFQSFPYYNDERGFRSSMLNTFAPNKLHGRRLEDATVAELNAMSLDDLQITMNAQRSPHYIVPQSSSVEMRFAYDENMDELKRGIMLDRLTSRGEEPELTSKLIKLYRETKSIPVKEKIISGLMIYSQQNFDLDKATEEQKLVKSFFSELLYERLTPKAADNTIRGFIDLHTSDEIMINLIQLDSQLTTVNKASSIMLKYALVYKSKELQPIYMKSITKELHDANDSDLDSYLFGPLSLAYKSRGKNLLEPKSKQIVINYLKETRYKYTASNMLKASSNDLHRTTTAPYYFELIKNMGDL